jgi:hypothetical protein
MYHNGVTQKAHNFEAASTFHDTEVLIRTDIMKIDVYEVRSVCPSIHLVSQHTSGRSCMEASYKLDHMGYDAG